MTSSISSKSSPFAQGVVELLNLLTPENKNQFLGKLSLKELMALLPRLTHVDLQSRVMDRIERIVEKRGTTALENVTQGQDKVIEKLFQRLMRKVKSEINHDISKIDRRVLEHLFKKDASAGKYRTNRKILKTPPSSQTAAQQVVAIKNIMGMIKTVSPAAQQPKNWRDLIALFEDGISKLKYRIFKQGEPKISKIFEGVERITGKGENPAIKIPPEERKALLAALAAKTKEKVQKEMNQSAAFYGMTIGEQVAKHAHVETEALGSGGEASFADEIERRALEKMKGDPSLTGSERERFEAYCRAADRSREFNDALEAVFAFMEATPPESMSAADIQQLAIHLTALTDEFYSQVLNLKDDESFFMNAGHLNHAFRIAVHRRQDFFDITLCEPGGGMEATILAHSGIAPQIRATMLKEAGYPVHTGLKITVSRDKFEKSGYAYTRSLLERSAIGLEDQLACQPIAKAIEETKGVISKLPGWRILSGWLLKAKLQIQEYRELIPWKAKWTHTLEVFGAIAPETAQLLPQMQRQQLIGACYAKRLRPNEVHEMGFALFHKLNGTIHQNVKEEALADCLKKGLLDESSYHKLMDMRPRKLTPVTLKKAAEVLGRCETIPPHQKPPLSSEKHKENAEVMRCAVLMWNHQIARLKAPKALFKTYEEALPKASFSSVMTDSVTVDTLREATKITRIRPNRARTKEHSVEMEIKGVRSEVSKRSYFTLILQNPDFLFDREVSDMVLFLSKDRELNAKEKLLASKLLALQRARMPKATEETCNETEKRLIKAHESLKKAISKAKPFSPDSSIAAYAEVLKIQALQIEVKLAELRDFRQYLQNPGFPETKEEASRRKNHPSYIAAAYFEAVEQKQASDELLKSAPFH